MIRQEYIVGGDSKYFYAAILRKLPKDVKVLKITLDLAIDAHWLHVYSDDYPAMRLGDSTPELDLNITDFDIEFEKSLELSLAQSGVGSQGRSSARCICDFNYTGRSQHLTNCPAKK